MDNANEGIYDTVFASGKSKDFSCRYTLCGVSVFNLQNIVRCLHESKTSLFCSGRERTGLCMNTINKENLEQRKFCINIKIKDWKSGHL